MDIGSSEILELVRRALTPDQIERSLVYWYKRVLKEGEAIKIGPQISGMPFDGMIVFVDLAPRVNWAHPCLYLLVDIKTLNIKVIEASLPPSIDPTDEKNVALLNFGQSPPHERNFTTLDS